MREGVIGTIVGIIYIYMDSYGDCIFIYGQIWGVYIYIYTYMRTTMGILYIYMDYCRNSFPHCPLSTSKPLMRTRTAAPRSDAKQPTHGSRL